MKINIHWVNTNTTNRLAQVNVFNSNDLNVYMGLFLGSKCRSLAQHLRAVADELDPQEGNND